jgi:hypothetical protein
MQPYSNPTSRNVEDDLNMFHERRRTKFVGKWKMTLIFRKWKMTLSFLSLNERRHPFLSNGRQPKNYYATKNNQKLEQWLWHRSR